MLLKPTSLWISLIFVTTNYFAPVYASEPLEIFHEIFTLPLDKDIQKLSHLISEVEALQNELELIPLQWQEDFLKLMKEQFPKICFPMDYDKLIFSSKFEVGPCLRMYEFQMSEFENINFSDSYKVSFYEMNLTANAAIELLDKYKNNFRFNFQMQFFTHCKNLFKFYKDVFQINPIPSALKSKRSPVIYSQSSEINLPSSLEDFDTMGKKYGTYHSLLKDNTDNCETYIKVLLPPKNASSYSKYEISSIDFDYKKAIQSIFEVIPYSECDEIKSYPSMVVQGRGREVRGWIDEYIRLLQCSWLENIWQQKNWSSNRIEKFKTINEKACEIYLKYTNIEIQELEAIYTSACKVWENARENQ